MTKRKTKQANSKRAAATKPTAGSGCPGTISELARSRGVSRTVLNRAFEVGALPPELFEMRGRQRHIVDFDAAAEALDEFLTAGGAKLGRPPSQTYDFDPTDEKTWPSDADGLRVVRAYWEARVMRRAVIAFDKEHTRTADLHASNRALLQLTRARLSEVPEMCATEIATKFDGVDPEVVRAALRPSVERILVDLESALTAQGMLDANAT